MGIRDTFVATNAIMREASVYMSQNETSPGFEDALKADSLYSIAESLAKESGDFYDLASIYRQKAYLHYYCTKDYARADSLIDDAIAFQKFFTTTDDSTRCYIVKTLVLIGMDSLKEAEVWLDRIAGTSSPLMYADYLRIKAEWHERKGEYRQANELIKRSWCMSDSVFAIQRQNRIVEFQNALTRQGLVENNQKLELKVANQRIVILVCVIVFLLICGMLSLYLRSLRRRQFEIANALRRRIVEEANRHESMTMAMRDRIMTQDETIQRLHNIKANSSEVTMSRRSHQLSGQDLKDIRDLLDICYDNFTRRVAGVGSQLTEADVDLVCLVKLGLSNKEIATLMGSSSEAVRQRKYRLRNSRFSIPDGTRLEDYIASL